VFAPFFFDNRDVEGHMKLGFIQVQRIIGIITGTIVLLMLGLLFLQLSRTDPADLWRSKRETYLLSLQADLQDYINLRKLNSDTAELLSLRLERAVRLGSDLLGGIWFASDPSRIVVAHTNPEMEHRSVDSRLAGDTFPEDGVWTDFNLDGIPMTGIIMSSGDGWMVGYFDETRNMTNNRTLIWNLYLLIVSLALIVVPLILFFIHRNAIIPLGDFSSRARTFSNGTPVVIRNKYFIREIDDLAHSLNDMMDAVMNREESLRLLNESLEEKVAERTRAHEDTIETLRSARDQLMLSEKMSVLGSLVSGVAHEINTPLGIGVTAASFLSERTDSIYKEWGEGTLTQEDMEHYFKDSDEASRIIQKNLEHAARILNSLKRVAVDQQMDECREFELGSYIEDIILSLKHQLKSGGHRIDFQPRCVALVNISPGIITQILNNLVFNSVVHGFDGKSGGLIRIGCREEQDQIVMSYEDDGRGLTEEESRHIFDQFFTTRRDSGGTGLGMNIVLNLITGKLKGQIQVNTPEGGGTGFTLRFPKETD